MPRFHDCLSPAIGARHDLLGWFTLAGTAALGRSRRWYRRTGRFHPLAHLSGL